MENVKTKKWYILKVAPLKDKKAIEVLKKTYSSYYGGLDDIEVISPTHDTVTVVNNQRKVETVSSIPGYIIVETDDIKKIRVLLPNIKEIVNIMGDDKKGIYNTLSEKEVNNLIGNKKLNDPSVPFKVMDEVMVLEGAFSGFKGLISKYDDVKNIITVDISIFGRKTPFETDIKNIKKISV